MNRTYGSLIIVIILVFSLILAGCGKGNESNNLVVDVPDETMNPNNDVEELDMPDRIIEPIMPFINPLTGIGTMTEMKERPIAVIVENQAQARPQDGLHKADIVYEILAEGDITRFVAVFQSQTPDVIGPVRSMRPYLAQLSHNFDALIVHAGWSQEGINYIVKHKLAHFDQVYGDDAYYWRDKSRKAPHNLYTSTKLIREGAVKKKFREEWNSIGPKFYDATNSQTITGQPAASVKIHYIGKYHVGYEYDPILNRYNRSMIGEPHKDKTSSTQLTADNIMVLFTKHKIVDKIGRRHIDVSGPGSGYLIQRGQLREITWDNKKGMITPYINGTEAELLPGQTWVQIVPEGSKVEFQ